MPPEFFEVLRSPLFWIFFFPVALLGSLIPSILIKLSLSMVFREYVSLAALLLAHVLLSALALLSLVLLPDPDLFIAIQEVPWAQVALSLSSTLITAVAFSLFIPNVDGDLISVVKWLVALVVSWLLYVVFSILFVLAWLALQLPVPVT